MSLLLPVRSRSPEAPLERADVVVLGIGLASGLILLAESVVDAVPGWASAAAYCIVAFGVGVWLFVAPGEAPGRRWKRYLAAALMVWAVGQFELFLEMSTGHYGSPDIGDAISVWAFPLAVAGMTSAIRSEAFVRPVLRMVIDAVLLASAASLVIWRGLVDPDMAGGRVAFLAVVIFMDAVVAAFSVLLFIRRPLPSTGLLAAGISLFALIDGISSFATNAGHTAPIGIGALACVSVTAFATGARAVAPEPDDGADLARDMREASITIVLVAAMVVASGAHMLIVPRMPTAAPVVFTMIAVVGFFIRHVVDHSQRLVTYDLLRRQATTDPLTGVRNRFAFEGLNRRRIAHEVDVLVVGIDGFEQVNAALGHAEGDAMLVRVAGALSAQFAGAIVLVRLESDEFALVARRSSDLAAVAFEAREVAAAAAGSDLESAVAIRVTVGAASGQPLDADVFELVGRAQRARHLASMSVDSSVRLYDDLLQARDERDRLIDERLGRAIESGAITVHFQPIVAVTTGRVSGVEVLARWSDPLLGIVTPDEFIGRAEATGLIGPLGLCVLRQAVQAAVTLRLPERGIRVGVNVSPAQLRCRSERCFADRVAEVLADAGLAPESLMVEVTESMLVEEHDVAVDELRQLAATGVEIAIDDFGSGFWALGYFRWLAVHTVKIDRSLVQRLASDERSRAVVAAIVDLSTRLGMHSIAEGVEDIDTVRAAWDLGVRSVQGFVYSRPVPVTELDRVIELIDSGAMPRRRAEIPMMARMRPIG